MTTTEQPTGASLTRAVLLTLSIVSVLFGDVLAFNQLATQSAIDAMTQSLVFSIGAAGGFATLHRLIAPSTQHSRLWAAVPGALSFAAFAIWKSQPPIGWSILVTCGAAIALSAIAVRSLRVPEPQLDDDKAQLIGLLCLAQTIIFLYLAVLVAADAQSVLFG